MGEYFSWVNIDKKEYLLPSDFNCGSKSHESLHNNNPFLCALSEILSTQWRGDRVVFIGDEGNILPCTPYPILQELKSQATPEHYFDYICENYRNVSCQFKAAEEYVRESITDYLVDLRNGQPCACVNEYGIDINNPFAGFFQRTGMQFRYTVNHTKKVYYSHDTTKILYKDGSVCDYVDPLPMLMAYGRSVEPGAWLGDIIGVSNIIPKEYTFLQTIQLNW